MRNRVALIVSASVLAVLLSGCSGAAGGGLTAASTPGLTSGAGASAEPSEEGDDEDDADDETPVALATECVDGTWSADLNELAAQAGSSIAAAGVTVLNTGAVGTQTLVIAREGVLGFQADMTISISAESSGLAMTVESEHSGDLSASWTWGADATAAGGTMQFSDFNNANYTVVNTATIAGQSTSAPVDLPSGGPAGNVPMTVTCTGDSLTTQSQGAPFTVHWTRIGPS